ncbi:MAG: hypothetical protein KF847_07840 [Pirellulales bacterium]|nr:hypothetical protein [Pirellulales bacterium]
MFVAADPAPTFAETGYDGWLRYSPLPTEQLERVRAELPAVIVSPGDSPVVVAAAEELVRGFRGMTGRVLRIAEEGPVKEAAIVLSRFPDVDQQRSQSGSSPRRRTSVEGFSIDTGHYHGQPAIFIHSSSDRGLLYGAFALLRYVALKGTLVDVALMETPCAPVRIVNQWDNLDGSIERGYGGRSIFWENDHVVAEMTRIGDYARLLASVGINGCSINNVNADPRVISAEYLPEVARIAAAMRPWGVQVYLSLSFAAPREVGSAPTFDPLDPVAVAYWKEAIDAVYRAVPDLGGFVLKADSEGRLGPSQYGRSHADAANVIARAAQPHGGVLFYRGFVYDHRMDWRDLSLDRARAAYENFRPLDGQFEDNVVIQVKHGPIDFQVREPPSSLFSGLEKTNLAIELMVSQEYLGQQKHLVYQPTMWNWVLDYDLQAGSADRPAGTPVKELVAGRTFGRPLGGFVGVANVGRDANWLGHHLAMANLYGFGRLAWNADLSAESIAREWTGLTFGTDEEVLGTIVGLLMRSWAIYESYTGPLGIGTLTDIIHIHFGPGPESSEYNGWGQWHRANDTGVGMNRTVATGTGFIGQYRPRVAAEFESLDTCPDDLLLFMHHVPYVHRLASGKTVIQHFYDEHYAGAEAAAAAAEIWRTLAGRVDEQRHREVQARMDFQAGHAVVWRDAICRWFRKKSGVEDEQGRVGVYPGRQEAEDAELVGYKPTSIDPWEAASGSSSAQLPAETARGTATFRFVGEPGWYDVRVQYFDEEDGASRFRVRLGEQVLDEWLADDHVPTPTTKPDSHSSTRRTIRGVPLRPGDAIVVEGEADADERAGIDYVEIVAAE